MKKLLPAITRYTNIVLFKTYANLKRENDTTYLGCLWWVLEPLLNTAIFYVVFSYILKIRTENFVTFLYIGMAAYSYCSAAINFGANGIVANANLMQQVYLPKFLFVIIAVTNLTWKFIFSLFVLLALVWWQHMPITWAYLALPLLIVLQYLFVIGISFPLAAIIPYFQDGKTVLSTILGIGMWFSGVFYAADKVPASLHTLYYANPAAVLIEAYRAVLMYGQWPDWSHFYGITLVITLLWFFGLWLLHKIDRKVTKLTM